MATDSEIRMQAQINELLEWKRNSQRTIAHSPAIIPATVAMPLASAVAAVTWNPIPATYSILELISYARGDTAATLVGIQLTFNNDTGANYDSARNRWDATGANFPASTVGGNNIIIGSVAASTAPANTFDVIRITIPAYAGAVGNKVVETKGTLKTAATNVGESFFANSGWWKPATPVAITRLDLTAAAGNFIIGSAFYLLAYA